MGFSSNTGMSFRTKLQSNSLRAGIRCSATRSRSKHGQNITRQRFSLMNDLLKLAIEAHGGLERWRQFKEARASASITGALWHLKGQPNVLENIEEIGRASCRERG